MQARYIPFRIHWHLFHENQCEQSKVSFQVAVKLLAGLQRVASYFDVHLASAVEHEKT